jgi:hypothetical protein
MATIAKKKVGEDANVMINFEVSTGVYLDLDAAINIYASAKNGGNEILFSKNEKTGYQSLIRVDAYNYVAALTSANTRTLDIGHVTISGKAEVTGSLGDLKQTHEFNIVALYLEANPLQEV